MVSGVGPVRGLCCSLYSEPLNLGVGSPCQMVTFLVTPFLWFWRLSGAQAQGWVTWPPPSEEHKLRPAPVLLHVHERPGPPGGKRAPGKR